ncbi:MAG: Hpt domain-containing protein [Ruegeria sp.]
MIDWPRVTQLHDEVGAEDFGEVVEIFLEEVDEVITRVRADTGRADLERNLHFLKGSALSLGFQEFSKLCQDGERASAAGQAETVDLDQIIGSFHASRSEFQAGLTQHI